MSISALKQHKEAERRVHETLYNNLVFLTNFYPTSKEFNAVFRKDMFVKSNKSAFFEVVHYLLNILNSDLVKEKLTSWPAFDIKRETKFRSEVLQIINELKSRYEHADIPVLVSSALISPGGFKFAKFMLSVSQLVLFEHLKRSGIDVALPLKASKNQPLNDVRVSDLKKRVSLIESETIELIKNFETYHFKCNERALGIVEELNKCNCDIKNAKLEYETAKSEFDKKYSQYPSLKSLEAKLDLLLESAEKIVDLSTLYSTCKDLIQYLSSPDSVLTHDKDKFTIPKEFAHIFNSRDELSVIEFFQALHVFLKQLCFDLPVPTDSFIYNFKEKVQNVHLKFTNLNEINQIQHERFEEVLKNIKEDFGVILKDIIDGENKENICKRNGNSSDDTLAVPLED